MAQQIVLKSLDELGRFADIVVQPEEISNERALVPVTVEPPADLDLEALSEAISRATQELRQLAQEDARFRHEAEDALAQLRRIRAVEARLERVELEAKTVANQAAALAERAFAPDSRATAVQIERTAVALMSVTRTQLSACKSEALALSTRDDVARLLSEERQREEALRRDAEEAEQEARLRDGVAQVEALVRAQNFDEARRTLGCLTKDHPNSPTLASFTAKIRRQECAVKAAKAEQTLREARRMHRREPKEAAALLEAVDVNAIPDALARQIYGCWLQACNRMKLEQAVLYAPGFGKGAVLIPAAGSQIEVVSAIGLARWSAGRRFSPTALRGARPLR